MSASARPRIPRMGMVAVLGVSAALVTPAAPAREAAPSLGDPVRPFLSGPAPTLVPAPVYERLKAGLRPAVASAAPGGDPTPQVSEDRDFDALPQQGDVAPADPTGAAGPGHVVAAVNSHLAVYSRRGRELEPPRPLRSGFRLPPPSADVVDFDPKVVYDQYAGRFVVAFLTADFAAERSWILIMSSRDPTRGWCRRKIRADQNPQDGARWADYPGLGFDRTFLYVTSNQFTFAATPLFDYAQVLAFPKDRLYRCSRSVRLGGFVGVAEPGGSAAFTLQPAVSSGPADHGYLVSSSWSCFIDTCDGDSIVLYRISLSQGRLRLRRVRLGVESFSLAPPGYQRDAAPVCCEQYWDTGDLRLTTAFYDARRDRVYTAHAVISDFENDLHPIYGAESAVRWYEVRPAPSLGRSSVTRSGLVGEGLSDAAWPSVATDRAGRLVVAYSRAGAEEYLSSAAAAVGSRGSGAGPALLLHPGETLYDQAFGPERWGDFTAASRDPVDGRLVWVFNQYARGGVSAIWQQRVSGVRVA